MKLAIEPSDRKNRAVSLSRSCSALALVLAALLAWLLRNVFPPIDLTTLSQHPAWQVPERVCIPVCLLLMASVARNVWRPSTGQARRSPGVGYADRLSASRGVWVALVTLALLTCRWGTLAASQHNLDEAESINAARVLAQDGRFWLSVDVGTHGPMISLGQRLLPALGLRLDFASSHLLAVFTWVGVVFLTYVILRRAAPPPLARLLVLPLVFLFGALRGEEYACFNGEHVLVFVTLASFACLVCALLPPYAAPDAPAILLAPRWSVALLFGSGALAGSLPWAKIQGVPLAVALFVLCAGGVWFVPSASLPIRARLGRLAGFALGFLLPTSLIVLWTASVGTLNLMTRSYFEWNLTYAARFKDVQTLRFHLFVFKWAAHNYWAMSRPQLIFLLSSLIGVAVWVARRTFATLAADQKALLVGTALLAGAGWFCALKPGNLYQHYLLIPLVPGFLISALCWSHLVAAQRAGGNRAAWARRPALHYAVLGVLAPWLFWIAVEPQTDRLPRFLLPSESVTEGVSEDLVRRIARLTREEERIAVWGWLPNLYVAADRLPATRTTACLREATPGFPMQDYFYRMWLSDFDRSRPVVFVDEMRVPVPGGSYQSILKVVYDNIVLKDASLPALPQTRFTHENYPELARRIRAGYTLFHTTPDGIRVWIRNDCRARLGQSPSV